MLWVHKSVSRTACKSRSGFETCCDLLVPCGCVFLFSSPYSFPTYKASAVSLFNCVGINRVLCCSLLRILGTILNNAGPGINIVTLNGE